jgi:dethiobiotin synthetase
VQIVTSLVVTATDTDVGKTVFSAALVASCESQYWKPVQAGRQGGTDRERVAALSGCQPAALIPERYVLSVPASPHFSAAEDGVEIDVDTLTPPDVSGRLVIEGAGGLMVPLTRDVLLIDVFARWNLPVVVCARTTLGTINHTLLSLSALRARNIPVLGVAFIGDENKETQNIIASFGQVRELGRLPRLEKLDREELQNAFRANFVAEDFFP